MLELYKCNDLILLLIKSITTIVVGMKKFCLSKKQKKQKIPPVTKIIDKKKYKIPI